MKPDKPYRATGRAWLAPIGEGPPNAADDKGNPLTITPEGVTRWTSLEDLWKTAPLKDNTE